MTLFTWIINYRTHTTTFLTYTHNCYLSKYRISNLLTLPTPLTHRTLFLFSRLTSTTTTLLTPILPPYLNIKISSLHCLIKTQSNPVSNIRPRIINTSTPTTKIKAKTTTHIPTKESTKDIAHIKRSTTTKISITTTTTRIKPCCPCMSKLIIR